MLSVFVSGVIISAFVNNSAYATDVTEIVSDTDLYNALKNTVTCANYNESDHSITVNDDCRTSTNDLNLGYKFITNISPLQTLFPNLQSLNLIGNDITTIPDSLSNLTNLQSLNLSSNCITTIPDSLSNLASLWNIGLSDNQISDITPLNNIPNLEYFDVLYQKATLEYNKKSFTSPSILPYIVNKIINDYGYELNNCEDGSNSDYCINITNATISEDYKTITANDTTQPVIIIIYDYYGDEDLSLTIAPNIAEEEPSTPDASENPEAPKTFDTSQIYILTSIIFIVSSLILAKKYSRR